MLIIFLRTIIIYFFLLFAMRLMGKGELSSLSPFQLIIIYMIAELSTIPLDNPNISLLNGLVGILTLVFLQVVISFLSLKSEWFKSFIKGKPSLVIRNGSINAKALRDMRINLNDFMEQIRIANEPVLSDIDYAIVEANGKLTVQSGVLPLLIVCQGTLYNENLMLSGLKERDLKREMRKANVTDIKEIFMGVVDDVGQIHLYVLDKTGDYAKEAN